MSVHVVVEVLDENGAKLDVKAGLDDGSTSHSFATVGKLGLALDLGPLSAGRYTLTLDVEDHPELPFQVEVTEKSGVQSLRFVGATPACCTASKQAAVAGAASSPALVMLSFALKKKHHEVVFVTGWDYSGGSTNLDYAETWRDDLYDGSTYVTKRKTAIDRGIFDHTVVTIFEAETGFRIRQIRGRKGWHEMDRVLQGTVRTHTKHYSTDANITKRHDDDSLSCTHAYAYVTELGATAPGTLGRLDFFSHSYSLGPILVNTYEDPAYDGKPERDPGDKDCRANKDFNATNMPRAADFKAAFAPDAVAKVWGCFYVQDLRGLIQKAARARDKDAKFKSRWGDATIEISANDLRDKMRTIVIPKSYTGQLAKAAGVRVWGVPLGLGSDLIDVGRRSYMYLEPKRFKLEYGWWKDVMGKTPELDGYVAYDP